MYKRILQWERIVFTHFGISLIPFPLNVRGHVVCEEPGQEKARRGCRVFFVAGNFTSKTKMLQKNDDVLEHRLIVDDVIPYAPKAIEQ